MFWVPYKEAKISPIFSTNFNANLIGLHSIFVLRRNLDTTTEPKNQRNFTIFIFCLFGFPFFGSLFRFFFLFTIFSFLTFLMFFYSPFSLFSTVSLYFIFSCKYTLSLLFLIHFNIFAFSFIFYFCVLQFSLMQVIILCLSVLILCYLPQFSSLFCTLFLLNTPEGKSLC